MRKWLGEFSVKTRLREPGSQWKNGHVESFDVKLGDVLLKVESFDTLR